MHTDLKMLHLQLFAEGGEGGGEASGESSQAAAESPEARLLALGVPQEKIRKRANYAVKSAPAAAAGQQSADTQQQAAAAPQAQEETENATKDGKRLTWDEILADPEYNKQMQATMSKRLKADRAKEAAAKDTLGKLGPVLDALGYKYDMDTTDLQKLDVDALLQKVQADESYYEDRASELGVDPKLIRQSDQKERAEARQHVEDSRNLMEQKVQEHTENILRQAEELKQLYPTFDLNKERENPAFIRMTAPGMPITVEQAYFAIHHKEIQSAMAETISQKVSEKLSNSIQSGKSRPVETGSSSQAASVSQINMRSKEYRDYIKQQMRAAAARGEKFYPQGGFPR